VDASRRAMLSTLPMLFTLPGSEVPPPKIGGDCADCLGPNGGTLASCSGYYASCVSSYDDSPQHFVTPWVYEGKAPEAALRQLEAYLRTQDDVVDLRRDGNYLYAQVQTKTGRDDIEFLVPVDDTTVELRAASRPAPIVAAFDAAGVFRHWGRFETYRKDLGFEILPVLRNRQSLLGGILQTPFDNYGPPPPQGTPTDELLQYDGTNGP